MKKNGKTNVSDRNMGFITLLSTFLFEYVQVKNVLNSILNISIWIIPRHLHAAEVTHNCLHKLFHLQFVLLLSMTQHHLPRLEIWKVIFAFCFLSDHQSLLGASNNFFLISLTLIPPFICPQLALYFKSR